MPRVVPPKGAAGRAMAREIRRRKREEPRKPSTRGSFAFDPLAPTPIARAQEQQRRKTQRARGKVAPVPLPSVPVVRNPSARQERAAEELFARSLRKAGGSPRDAGRVLDEVRRDPRQAGKLAALDHYRGSQADRLARATLQQIRRGGSPQQRAAVRLLERQIINGGGATPIPQMRTGPQPRLTAAGEAVLGRAILAGMGAPSRAKAGRAPARLQLVGASINLTDVSRRLMAATSLGGDSAENRFFKNAAGDVKALATAPFVGGYEVGAAAVEAARGDTGRAERLAEGAWEGVKQSLPGRVIARDWEGAERAIREHPLLSALDVSAVGAVAGRSAGAVARATGSDAAAGGLRGALARGGSTVRPPLALSDDASASLVERAYSRDSTRKAAQVAADARREPLRRADGSVVTVKQRGRDVPVLKATAGEQRRHQKREADFAAGRANSVERLVRDRADREMRVRGVKGRRGRDLVAMVVEGTITSAKHFDTDLRTHANRLKANIAKHESGAAVIYRHSGELEAAKVRLKLAEDVLASPRLMAQKEKIVAAGEEIGRKLNAREREAIELGLLDPTRAARAKLVPAAVEHMQARHFTPDELRGLDGVDADALRHGSVRRGNGQFMANRDVEKMLRERGRDPETIAYLPHRLDVRGGRAFHTQFRPGSRGTLDKAESRTGEAYRRGATEASTKLIQDQGVRQATQIAKARQLDRMVGEQGMKRPDGRFFTAREATELAQRLEADTGQRLVPMRAFAAKLDAETQRMIRDELQGPGGMETLGLRLLNDRVVTGPDAPGRARARNVVLVPAEYVEQLSRHLRPAGDIQKFFQMVNRPFRFSVLAQPRWLTGNFVEPFIVRLTTQGSGVNVFGLGLDVAAGTRMLRRMDRSRDPRVRQAAEEIRAQQLGGLFIGARGASVRRSVDELPVYGEFVSKLPVVREGAELARLAGRALMAPGESFFRINRAIENVAQRAALGRDVRRDLGEFRGSWLETLRLQNEALDEVAQGLVNTSTQRRFMRSQHELLGKYEGYPPWMRELIQGPMPFLPWALNAARFVFWTMPAHRTVQTALLVKVNDVVAKGWGEQHAGVPPGGLRLAVPTKAGGWIDLARYTPYGLTGPIAEGIDEAPKQALQGVSDQFMPQFSGALAALLGGEDPFGRNLQLDPSENAGETDPNFGQQTGVAANSLAEAFIPYLSMVRRLREGGGTAYAGSTVFDPDVKPGTDNMSAARRVFDPFRPTYLGGGPGLVSRPGGGSSVLDRVNRSRGLRGAQPVPNAVGVLERINRHR